MEAETPIRITWQAEEEDYVRALRLHQHGMRGPAVAFWLLAPIVALLSVAYWLIFGRSTFIVAIAAVLVAVVFAYVVLRWFVLPRHGRKVFRQQKALQRPLTLELDESGLRSTQGEEDRSYLPWADCHRWLEGSAEFLIYRSDALFHLVPKAALSEAETERVRTILTSQVRRR